MTYNLANPLDKQRFLTRASTLMGKGGVVDLTEKTFRSHNQNSYLHLLIGVVAMETGNTIEDTKEHYYKRLINPDIFRIRRTDKLGNTIESLRSTTTLSQEEMAVTIDRLKRWGAEQGFYMPSPEDETVLQTIEIELGRYKNYL